MFQRSCVHGHKRYWLPDRIPRDHSARRLARRIRAFDILPARRKSRNGERGSHRGRRCHSRHARTDDRTPKPIIVYVFFFFALHVYFMYLIFSHDIQWKRYSKPFRNVPHSTPIRRTMKKKTIFSTRTRSSISTGPHSRLLTETRTKS